MLMIVIDCQVCIIVDLDIGNLVIIEIVLVDFLGDDVQTDIVLLFYHDLHLV